MSRLRAGVVFVVTLSLLGCTGQTRFDDLQKRTTQLEKEVLNLQTSISDLKLQHAVDMINLGALPVVLLKPGAEGYSIVQADFGRATVALTDVEPYANGVRVTLQFGNLTSATINGVAAKVEWGSVDQNGVEVKGSVRSREVRFPESFPPGVWTSARLSLAGIPPARFGFVRLKNVTHTGIRLRQQY